MPRKPVEIAALLQKHFEPLTENDLVVVARTFPARTQADLQRAVDGIFADGASVERFCGVMKRFDHEGLDLANLMLPDRNDPAHASAARYHEIDIGEEAPLRCLDSGLWFLQRDGMKVAFLLGPAKQHGCEMGVRVQVAAARTPDGDATARALLERLEAEVRRSASYRGKVLSLEKAHPFLGTSGGLSVHRLPAIGREQVILPEKTLALLERNLLGFCANRQRLRELGLPTRKGLLFYGPPGTGKTHTIRWLAGALPGHTTLLVTAEQMGLLSEYMALARLLQPSLVVIEDVDLVAADREALPHLEQRVSLHQLLNEMDGLRQDADVLVILTTNRADTLEAALASRPGRVDQAIEFPLPDEEGRRRLVHLYARGLRVSDDLARTIARRTDRVSAAFVKELMRRTAQALLERGGGGEAEVRDVDQALEELLFAGGSLNRAILGAATIDGGAERAPGQPGCAAG